jgi:hypothetical protein
MNRDVLVRNIQAYFDELAGLLDSPRKRFSSLAEKHVPETPGLYVIYREEPFEFFYAGTTTDLRFRIVKNHLAYHGDDNLVQYIMKDFGLASCSDARNFIRKECSVHWLELGDQQRLFYLEHLAIAALRPRFNKG